MEEKPKNSMGKLYEKFEIVKGHTHNLEVAIANNHLTNQEEVLLFGQTQIMKTDLCH